jgi:hypothetical protein
MRLLGDGALLDLQALGQKQTGKTYLLPDDGECLH